jgi:hypothetical protein
MQTLGQTPGVPYWLLYMAAPLCAHRRSGSRAAFRNFQNSPTDPALGHCKNFFNSSRANIQYRMLSLNLLYRYQSPTALPPLNHAGMHHLGVALPPGEICCATPSLLHYHKLGQSLKKKKSITPVIILIGKSELVDPIGINVKCAEVPFGKICCAGQTTMRPEYYGRNTRAGESPL